MSALSFLKYKSKGFMATADILIFLNLRYGVIGRRTPTVKPSDTF